MSVEIAAAVSTRDLGYGEESSRRQRSGLAIVARLQGSDSRQQFGRRQLGRTRCWYLGGVRRLNLDRGGRIYQAVVAALDIWMILIAGNEQNRVLIAVRERAERRNLALITDKRRREHEKRGARRNESIQVNQGAVFPQERRDGRKIAWHGIAHNL